MSEKRHAAFFLPSGGMNGALSPEAVQQTQYCRGVNIAIRRQLPGTRPGIVIHNIGSQDANVENAIALGNVQGARFFNPAKGQGGLVQGANNPTILLASAGRKYALRITGRGALAKVEADEITNGHAGDRQLHLAWWATAENYALCQDGQSNCFIWDSQNPAFLSTGYNVTNKELSKVPNGGTVMCYAHGRLVAVVNSRFVLVGDVLHKSSLSDASNLLAFTEQSYWATGRYFAPPSAMGNILAAEILPTKNTQHGHGELMLHCEDGVFSIDLNVYPRSKWNEQPMVKHALLKAGATGPYALASYDGDQIFRSARGIQTLRSAAAESQRLGNPETPISRGVSTWLDSDYPRWLRFASVATWTGGKRLFCTVSPHVQGRFRGHRGAVVLNYDPIPDTDAPPAWEGLWTLPAEAREIVQFVSGVFDGEERLFALCRGADGRTRLVEFLDNQTHDILSDGSAKPIEAQLITRAIDADRPLSDKQFLRGSLYLREIGSDVEWKVYARSNVDECWRLWQEGSVRMENQACYSPLTGIPSGETEIKLGEPPSVCGSAKARWMQFLIKLKGRAQLEGLIIHVASKDSDTDRFDPSALSQNLAISCCNYNDYEYSFT